MPNAILDTSFFIDLWNGDPGARSVWRDIFAGDTSCSYSAITAFELWVGDISEAEADFYEGLFFFLSSVDLTEEAARIAADLLHGMSRDQRERLFRDALIAATASTRDETVYTRNLHDFALLNVPAREY